MAEVLPYVKALADETRLRLMAVLARHELNVNEIVALLGMGQPRVSHHLKVLSMAGLLKARRDGSWVYYSAALLGRGHEFWQAISPFCRDDAFFDADLRMARSIIEERAKKTRRFFNAIAEDWDRLNKEIMGGFDLPGSVLAFMPVCATAVDLGCGTGTVLARLCEKAPYVIGVDGSPRMLEMARRRFAANDQVSLRIGDLEHLPLRDGEAQFASINMVLHHLSHPQEALPEIARVLEPGGRLVIADFEQHDNERMREEYGDLSLGFDVAVLSQWLDGAGFRVERLERAAVKNGLTVVLISALRQPEKNT